MTKTQIILILAALLTAPLLIGCDEQMGFKGQERKNVTISQLKPIEPAKANYVKDETLANDDGDPNRGATDVAMEWADKYAKATQELLYANKRIGELEEDKEKLQTQIAQLKSDLSAYQRELTDANAMLNDMKKDLKEWRQNVLGIRKEFIASQNAILHSQYKILELLGGEVSREQYPSSPTTPDPGTTGQSNVKSSPANLAQHQEGVNP
ncbi:MAG: hypothetical protein JXA11_07845 [Phycisphaerae bacterium]|nr:hypothetical protein [Phycisphaerae bacterium]